MAFLFVTVTCISLCKKYRKMGVFPRGTHIDFDIYINPPDSAWFFHALQESCHIKAGKKSDKL